MARSPWQTWALFALVACGSERAAPKQIEGLRPVERQHAEEAVLERFVRRATLDLTGAPPTDAVLARAVDELSRAADLPSARAKLVADLLSSARYAEQYVTELESRAFGGQGRAQRRALACVEAVALSPACGACAGDACACTCQPVRDVVAETDALDGAHGALRAGGATSELERAYAEAAITYAGAFGNPAQRADQLFRVFLRRPAGPEELENAGAMMLGPIVDLPTIKQRWSGMLFGHSGRDESDLREIVFTSEVYREALVRSVFGRYLGREPSAAELGHFASQLDTRAPDARLVTQAVLSAEEYFGP